jgi:hypothetical protein
MCRSRTLSEMCIRGPDLLICVVRDAVTVRLFNGAGVGDASRGSEPPQRHA